MGDEITGGDLYYLWRVADVHMPRVADVFYDAGRLVGGSTSTTTPVPGAPAHIPPTTTSDSDAFRQNQESVSGATSSSLGAAWETLRNEMQVLYADVGTRVLDTSAGLNRAMKAFVDQDMVSGDALDNYINDATNHDKNDVESNPPTDNADDNPGEPDVPEGYTSDTDRKVEEQKEE